MNRLDQEGALGGEQRLKTRSGYQGTKEIEVGIRREQDVHAPSRSEPLARLVEQQGDIAVIRPGVPGAVGQIARFTGKGRGARYDDIETGAGCQCGKKVRAHRRDTVLKPVGTRVFGRGKRSVGIYVDGSDLGGAGPGRGKRENSRSRAHICHALAGQIEPPDERREKLAGEKVAGMEHGGPYHQPKPGRVRAPRGTPLQDEMIRKEMDGAAEPAPPLPMRDIVAVEAVVPSSVWTMSCIALLALCTLTGNTPVGSFGPKVGTAYVMMPGACARVGFPIDNREG